MKRGAPKLLIFPLAAAFGIIFAIIVAELSLSTFWPQKTYKRLFADANRCWVSDSSMFVHPKPNCSYKLDTSEFKEEMTTNSRGFRGPEVSAPKEANTIRIVVTGDSFVFGYGVKEELTFVRLLEKYLREKKIFGDKNVQVVNAGYWGGFSPDGHLINLRKMIQDKYEPDFVIMSTFVFNDFSDMDDIVWTGAGQYSSPEKISPKSFVVTKEGLLVNKNSQYKTIYQKPILKNLHTAIFINENLPVIIDKFRVRFLGWKPYIPADNAATDDNYLGIHFQDCIFGEKCHRRFSHLFWDMVSVFEAGQWETGKASKLKPNFLVMVIPADFQIYEDAAPKYGVGSSGIQQGSKIENPNPQKRLTQMLEQGGIAYLDLLPAFRKNSEPRKYFPKDGHWNIHGTELAARNLTEWFEQNMNSPLP